MSADVLPFRSKAERYIERHCGHPCPWCAQVIYPFQMQLHLQCVAEAFDGLFDDPPRPKPPGAA
jgi:hypothetical protein